MEEVQRMRGTIKGISGHHIWIEAKSPVEFNINADVDIEIKEHKEKRSLNANAYFHVLCDELRQKLKISFAACKNQLIGSYGQIEYIGDVPATIKTNIEPERMREQETLHCVPISVADEDGVFWYRVYRGTHTYDSREMALLIDGTIVECEAQGIQTMTPYELERLKGYGEMCIICGKPKQHTHHLICGTSGRSFADKFGLVIPLCAKCHDELHKSGIAMDFSKMLGQAIWEKNYYMDLYNNLNKTKIDEARDRFRELNTSGSYM